MEGLALKVAIIIPTYNEKENLQDLLPKIIDILNNCDLDGRIIIVDDSSPDGTGTLAKELSEKLGKISVITRNKKLGIGSAYKTGFEAALFQQCEGIFEMDADGSHNPLYIPKFITKLKKGYDLIIGSRYVLTGKVHDWPLSRRIISKVTSTLTRGIFGLKTRDPTSGFRAYSARALNKIDLSKVKSDGYAFQVEMVLRCEKRGLQICEIPIEFLDRAKGKSKLNYEEMLSFLKNIISLFFKL